MSIFKKPVKNPMNKCGSCGKFISFKELGDGASIRLVTPDSAFTEETYDILCKKCNDKEVLKSD